MKKEKMTVLPAAAERQIHGAACHGSRLNRSGKKRAAQLAHNVNRRKKEVNTAAPKIDLADITNVLRKAQIRQEEAAPKIDLTNITNKDAKRFTFFEKKFIISS